MPEYPDEDGATKLMDAEDLSIRPAAVNFDADDLLISALDSLPRVERQAILLTDIKEFSITETAEVMRKSEATVKQYIARAYSRMREFLSRSLNRSTLEMRHEQATSESRTRECAIAAEKPTADAVAGEGQVLGDEAADLNSAPSPNSAVNDSAAVVPRSEQDRPMTSHQRYARLSTLLRTIQDRAALPHRVQRFSSEIGEQQEMIKGWMEELDAMVTKNQATGAIQST